VTDIRETSAHFDNSNSIVQQFEHGIVSLFEDTARMDNKPRPRLTASTPEDRHMYKYRKV